MQDEVNEKVVSLAIKTSKLTAEVLQKAMKALLAKGKGQLTKSFVICQGQRYSPAGQAQ